MYTVFARKYRPRNFDEVIGQKHCTTTLKNAISQGRIAHAYLFAGPRGVGKTTTARILAKALNCDNGPTPIPCNECVHCKGITQGSSVDVIEIDGASNRGIDEIRNLRENARYVPSSSRYKVYIIDEVHMLTDPAFNALLKILEEPPSHIIFIFATTQPQKLPQTILSRCQRFNFRRIGFEDTLSTLKVIIEKEKIKIEENAIKLIARKADGALRDAEGMLDQLVAYSDSLIREEDVRNVLGLPSEDVFFNIQSYIAKGNTKELLSLMQQMIESGISAEEILTGFLEHLRLVLLVNTNVNISLLPEERKKYITAGSQQSPNVILRIMRFLLETRREMRYSENPDIYLLETMTRLSAFKTVPIEKIIESLEATPYGTAEESPAVSEAKESYRTDEITAYGTTPKTNMQEIWEQVAGTMEKESKTIASIIALGDPVELDKNRIVVEFPNDFHRDAIKEKKILVEKHLSKIIGRDLKIVFKKGKAKDIEKESAILKKTLRFFSAEVVSRGG